MSSEKRQVLSVVKSATGDLVIIGEAEITHALAKHFRIPKVKLLEIVEQVLIDPTTVYLEEAKGVTKIKSYYLFYRLDDGGYLVAVVKVLPEGAFFSSVYPTGPDIRHSHQKMKRIK